MTAPQLIIFYSIDMSDLLKITSANQEECNTNSEFVGDEQMLNQSDKTTPDYELVEQFVTEQDEFAFQEIVTRYEKLVWHVCYNYFRNSQDAEDMTQEVFIKVYRYIHSFEGRSSLKTWLYRIASNTCQNEIRRRDRRPQESDTELDLFVEFLSNNIDSPERIYQNKQTRQKMAQTFADLRPDEWQVLKMRHIDEVPYSDIAETLHIGLSAAKMRVKRARQTFQMAYAS